MNLLLDTHAFLWFIGGDTKLSQPARELIEAEENAKLVSIASIWEMGIKISLGRLSLGQPFEQFIPKQIQLNGFGLLPLRISHVAKIVSLPFHHRDPFDRLIVGQCMSEELSVVSADRAFDKYPVHRLW